MSLSGIIISHRRCGVQISQRFRVLLTYQLQGGFHAYMENHRELGDEKILDILDELSGRLKDFR